MLTLRDVDGSALALSDWSRLHQAFVEELAGAHLGEFAPLPSSRSLETISTLARLPERILLVRDGEVVGLARIAHSPPDRHELIDYFVMPASRGRGVGRGAARLLFDRFAGRWTLTVNGPASGATRFWQTTLDAYAPGRYALRVEAGVLRFDFVTPSSGAR